jgi:predicted dehydrogenase
MYDQHHKDIDAVLIAIPDHSHACATMMAIQRGKHVFCEKPLAHSIGEVRAVAKAAREHKVNTQMGIQAHTGEKIRRVVECVWSGVLGQIKEVHGMYGGQFGSYTGAGKRLPSKPVPPALDWEAWIGPAPFRDYHDDLHPQNWRRWWDFGSGPICDMGIHILDNAFWSLGLGVPDNVELLRATGGSEEQYPDHNSYRWEFPARGARAAFTMYFHDTFGAEGDLHPVTIATPDDCARFQNEAESLSKNWRHVYPKARGEVECLSRNTILKWSRTLQAAFQRANKNAGKKCVRGVVEEHKLLTRNPWLEFTWIEGHKRHIRQFDTAELIALLDFLEAGWPEVTVAIAVAKTLLWSWSRRLEVATLDWPSLRAVGGEYHFHIVGKWGVEKWFRIPEALYRELAELRTDSPFVFAAYNEQLRRFHRRRARSHVANLVSGKFNPELLGDWFHRRIVEWSQSLPKGHATTHVFRKTTLQLARRGEDVNRAVAEDARLSESVMMTNYVMELDEEFRQRSNRTYHRILAALPLEVAGRYGYSPTAQDRLEEQIRAAVAAKDWDKAAELSQLLRAGQQKG